jgi:hypothetical protein
MEAIVVYDSVWGNTKTIAAAIAQGLGPDVRAFATDTVPRELLATADLIVAGSPVYALKLPTEATRASIVQTESHGPEPDLTHPSLLSWLDGLPEGHGFGAAFETRLRFSPMGATGTIEKKLGKAGYRRLGKAKFVRGKYGPLREGELERAREWGRALRHAMETSVLRAA